MGRMRLGVVPLIQQVGSGGEGKMQKEKKAT